MIKTKIIQTLLMVAVVLGLFISCGNILEVKEPVAPKNNDNTKAWVSLGVSHANRTAFPEYDLDATDLSYTLTGKLNQGEEKVIKTWTSETETSAYFKMKADTEVLVDAGEWNFTLIVKKGESEILRGSQATTIQAGQNSLTFSLKAAKTGTGSLNYTLNITQSGVQKVKASLLTLGREPVAGVAPAILDVTDSKAIYVLDAVEAGTYFVQMEAYTDSEATKLMKTWLEVVYIAPGATTTGEGTLGYTLVTVTFDTNGGSDVDAQTVESGQKVPEPAKPTKNSHFFDGWYRDEQFTNKYDFNDQVTSSFPLYAKWLTPSDVISTFTGDGPHTLVVTGEWNLLTLANALKDESKKVNLDLSGVEGLETIGDSAFFGCSSLTSITIPASVKTIGETAFFGCSNLATVTFGVESQLTTIDDYAFYECSSFKSITIPASVTTIGVSAFDGCSKLATVTFGVESQLTSIGYQAFFGCSSLTSITIPASVTTIDDYAFYECRSFKSITIPASVTTIGDSAFSGCSGLDTVTMEADNPPLLEENAFPSGVTSILVPKGSVNAYKAATNWKDYSDHITD